MVERRDRYRDMREASWSAATAAAQDGVPPVGDVLRQRREELRYDLAGVAASLRIRRQYLQAIEDANYTDLPGQAYIVGFLRSYAELLGLDAAEIVDRFKNETGGRVAAVELYMPIPVNENRVPGGLMLIIAGVLAVVLYGGWYFYAGREQAPTDEVAKVPDRLAHPPAAPAAPTPAGVLPGPAVQALLNQAQPTAPEVGVTSDQPGATSALADALTTTGPTTGPTTGATTTLPATPGGVSTPSGTTAKGAAPAKPPAAPAGGAGAGEGGDEQASLPADLASPPPPPSATPAAGDTVDKPTITAPAEGGPDTPVGADAAPIPHGRVFGITSGPVRVVLRATEDSWIQVRDAKGTVWASRVLHPGDSFRAPQVPGLTLETGNAGGLTVSLDGHDLAPLGEKAQVRRGVSLEPDALGAAAPAGASVPVGGPVPGKAVAPRQAPTPSAPSTAPRADGPHG